MSALSYTICEHLGMGQIGHRELAVAPKQLRCTFNQECSSFFSSPKIVEKLCKLRLLLCNQI